MLAAEAAVLPEFQPLCRLLLVLVGHVITILAIRTLQHDIVSHINS
jgi:hypothetical protein